MYLVSTDGFSDPNHVPAAMKSKLADNTWRKGKEKKANSRYLAIAASSHPVGMSLVFASRHLSNVSPSASYQLWVCDGKPRLLIPESCIASAKDALYFLHHCHILGEVKEYTRNFKRQTKLFL